MRHIEHTTQLQLVLIKQLLIRNWKDLFFQLETFSTTARSFNRWMSWIPIWRLICQQLWIMSRMWLGHRCREPVNINYSRRYPIKWNGEVYWYKNAEKCRKMQKKTDEWYCGNRFHLWGKQNHKNSQTRNTRWLNAIVVIINSQVSDQQ